MIVTALAAAVLAGCSTQPKYVISGQIDGLEGTVYLRDREELLDSAVVENGAFRLEGIVEEPRAAYIYDRREPAAAQMRVFVVVEKGEMQVAADPEREGAYKTTGSPSNDACVAINKQRYALLNEYKAEETTEERREAIVEEFNEVGLEGVKANPDNLFGVLLLQDVMYERTAAELQALIDGFSPAMQKHSMMVQIKEYVAKKLLTEPGQSYVDFEQPTADGESLSLKSAIENPANKYVLLDFWASWCGPCMGEVPALKEAYAAYHDKGFEIFGVSLDNNKERWTAAIENNGMNWIHVSDLQGWQNAAAAEYGVRSIPANFLIDAEGKIVATGLRGDELKAKIAELLD